MIQNKKARFNYKVINEHICGIVLQGWEVKSIRAGQADIAGSHAIIRNNEVQLVGMVINPLTQASTHSTIDPLRTRKLLLKKPEINKLIGKVEKKGMSLIPLKVFFKKQLIKVVLGLCEGKKTYDKRQDIKLRDWQRDQGRALKKLI